MSRVKTQEELDQEARDEALARQLQAEADQNEQRAAQQQPSTSGGPNRSSSSTTNNNNQQTTTFVAPPEGFHSGGQTSLPQLSMPHVRCTKCNAINTIQPAKSQLQQLCGQCQKLLPPLGARQQQPGNGNGNYPASTPNFTNPPRPSGGGGDQTTTTTNGSGSSNSAPTLASTTNDGIIQGSVQTQQVQARCGQCQSINSLPVPSREPGTTISFRCGQCQAVNRVSM